MNIDITANRGFTLIELLVTIAIIGVLATLGVTAFGSARDSAKEKGALHEVKLIYDAINMLANDTGKWPGQQQVDKIGAGGSNEICFDGCSYGLSDAKAGIIATDGNYPAWAGPYRDEIPLDPWGHEYFFDTDYQVLNNEPCAGRGGCANAAVIGSYGPNGQGNNDYDSDDIIRIVVR